MRKSSKNKKNVEKRVFTPYSMNSLFSEFFREFRGAILGVCEAICGVSWGVFGRFFVSKINENYPDKIREKKKRAFALERSSQAKRHKYTLLDE